MGFTRPGSCSATQAMAFRDAGGEIPNESFGRFAIDLESGVIQERFGHHDLLFLATRRVADALCPSKTV